MNRDYIFVKFGDDEDLEDFDDIKERYGNKWFDIFFHINRTPFQLQHYALECMANDKLFDTLINNPIFDNTIANNEFDSSSEQNYVFW